VLECLRARSPDELVAALPHKRALILHAGVWWGPVVDGVELPEVRLEAMRAGAFAQVRCSSAGTATRARSTRSRSMPSAPRTSRISSPTPSARQRSIRCPPAMSVSRRNWR